MKSYATRPGYDFFRASNFFPISEPVCSGQQSKNIRLSKFLTTELYTEDPFQPTQNLRIGNSFARLIILQDRWFLIDLLGYLFLRKFEFCTSSLNSLYDLLVVRKKKRQER